jgi:hypothetical protein
MHPFSLSARAVLIHWMTRQYFCVCLEAAFAVLLVLLAFLRPGLLSGPFFAVERVIGRIAIRRRVAVLVVMAFALLGRAAVLPAIGTPQPSVHDEFSYLLAGKTFALGRVTNPPHPMWIHFESVHILQQPTYMSMYQPAQGLFLALGYKVAGRAWAGVWISVILMSGAICWMLQAWLPPQWALVGGLLVVVRWDIFSYWMNSYWGGAVPALAGALVIGSLPRLFRRSRVVVAFALGLGLALLVESRPYDGLVLSTTALALFAMWSVRRGLFRRVLKLTVLGPLFLVVCSTAAVILFYNAKITGNAFKLPYIADIERYKIAPLFFCQHLNQHPVYHSASLKQVYLPEVQLYEKGQVRRKAIQELLRKLKDFWLFYIGPLLTIPFAISVLRRGAFRKENTSFFLTTVAVMLTALAGEVWFYAHYAAPIMCIMVALLVQGLRVLRQYRFKGKPVGLFLSRALPAGCALLGAIPLVAAISNIPLSYWPLQWYGGSPDIVRPRSLTASLFRQHEKSLIIVRYSPSHPVGDEWVYNEPDIDKSLVIWARETDPKHDMELIRYFRDRSVWLLEADRRPLALGPYFPSIKAQTLISQTSP